MLVCPQCQYENPITNNFCQECGTSLTQNICAECGNTVSFDSLNCPVCGAVTGVIWWVVVTPMADSEAGVTGDGLGDVAPEPEISGSPYLDVQQRYQLLEPISPPHGFYQEQYSRVLDRQPFQLSLLEALSWQQQEETTNATEIAVAQPNLVASATSTWSAALQQMAVPDLAYPYLALCEQYYPMIPGIHDVWQWQGKTIALLEDRSQFALLADLWQDPLTSLPLLQLLHWLYEMVELWQALEPWNCQASLLELSNLRVDEDQTLCLQRLYRNLPGAAPSLMDLGQLWQRLFAASQRTLVDGVANLLVDLETGKLETPDELRSRIEAIAHELDPTMSSTAFSSESAHFTFNAQPESDAVSELSMQSKTADMQDPIELEPMELDDMADVVETELDSDEMPTVVLPMQLFTLEEVGRTDIGRQREHNEDYFGIEVQLCKLESPSGKTLHARNLYILCDGMGGHASGEVASALAVDTLRRFFKDYWQNVPVACKGPNALPSKEVLQQAVQYANRAIYDVNQDNARSGSGRMGTTLVMVIICDTEVAVAHVGDSRLYRYTRKRGLEQVTVDHEVGQREIQRGVEPEVAYGRPDAYQLTQALGPRDEHFVKPDVQFFELNEDMLLLLGSDGLTDNDLLETHCESHVGPLISSQTNLDKGVSRLIDLANEVNGHDNITAIAIRAKVRPSLEHLR